MRRLALVFALSLAVVACGDDDGTVSSTLEPTTSAGATTTSLGPATTTSEGVVSGLDLVAGLRARGELPDTTTTTAGQTPATTIPGIPGEYVTITDDSGQIELRVPVGWVDVETSGWVEQGELIGPGLNAAPDVDAWRAEWGIPGVFIGASRAIAETPESLLDNKRWDGFCLYEGRDDYDDGLYVGRYDLYYDCGDELSVFLVIAAELPGDDFLIVVEIVIVTEDDLLAADEIIRSFLVLGADF